MPVRIQFLLDTILLISFAASSSISVVAKFASMESAHTSPRSAITAAHHHPPVAVLSELPIAEIKQPLPLPPRIAEECLSYLQFIELPALCRASRGFAAEVCRYFDNLSRLSSPGISLADTSLADVKFAPEFIKAHTRSPVVEAKQTLPLLPPQVDEATNSQRPLEPARGSASVSSCQSRTSASASASAVDDQ